MEVLVSLLFHLPASIFFFFLPKKFVTPQMPLWMGFGWNCPWEDLILFITVFFPTSRLVS